MGSRRNFVSLAVGTIALCSAGVASATTSGCAWGSSVGACGGLNFAQNASPVSYSVNSAQAGGWNVVGSAPGKANLQLPTMPKPPVSLAPVYVPIAPKAGNTFMPIGWANNGGPKWNQNGGTVGRPVMVGAVPEPETWLMMVGGIGLVGWFARRRAHVAATA